MVLAPEHRLVQELKGQIENWDEVQQYVKAAQGKSALERTDLAKEKTGVELKGVAAINPANKEKIPVFQPSYPAKISSSSAKNTSNVFPKTHLPFLLLPF